jgi:hypothetical protein
VNLADVMDDIANQLKTIDGLQVHPQPPDMATPTAGVVRYPDKIHFDETYGRGVDTMTLGVVIVAGRVVDRATRTELGAFCDGTGPRSIKAVLEGGVDTGAYTAFDGLVVTDVDFVPYAINGIDYVAALFMCDIEGKGTA